jgi:ribosomal protein S6--L-glutamate ligase
VIVGVAGIPGAWSSERIAESLRDTGAESFVFSLGDVTHDISRGRVCLGRRDLSTLDAIVVKKLGDQSAPATRLRLHALRALESAGVRVFSRADVIERIMDRYSMTMMLASHGVPIPDTLAVESPDALDAAVRALGDCVVKPVYTSKGRGMVRVGPADNLNTIAFRDGERQLVQRFVQSPGRDIGATVIGGKFAGAFYRVAREGEWMTTTAQGGRYAPCNLNPTGIELAEHVAAISRLDYTVVDLVESDGGFLVYEASAFGGYRGLLEATDVDPSVLHARHVLNELGG